MKSRSSSLAIDRVSVAASTNNIAAVIYRGVLIRWIIGCIVIIRSYRVNKCLYFVKKPHPSYLLPGGHLFVLIVGQLFVFFRVLVILRNHLSCSALTHFVPWVWNTGDTRRDRHRIPYRPQHSICFAQLFFRLPLEHSFLKSRLFFFAWGVDCYHRDQWLLEQSELSHTLSPYSLQIAQNGLSIICILLVKVIPLSTRCFHLLSTTFRYLHR